MRSLARVCSHALFFVLLVGCAQPTLVSCPEGEVACGTSCVELVTEENCGACGHTCAGGTSCVAGACQPDSLCATGNGGCGPDAFCMDIGGTVECLCKPGMTGDGHTCNACTTCSSTEFASTPCSPTSDAICAACTEGCSGGTYASAPCGQFNDLVCSPCSQCGPGQFPMGECSQTQNTQCGTCALGCTGCFGPGPSCFACDVGLVLNQGACVAPICGNGVVEPGEMCDDSASASGDGCSSTCQVEANHYCFGNGPGPSICRPGSCAFEPATALPLGTGFALDGAGTASAAGLLLSQRSMIHTTGDVSYPVVIEADVVYSGADITFVGTRGNGLRNATNGDEPTDTLHARLSSSVELAASTTVIASTPTPFTPSTGVPYRVRYIDDGFMASVEWFNLTNPSEGIALQFPTSFHGSADRAFVGGGDQGAVTIANVRVCSAPLLPVTAGLAARYSAVPSWTVNRDGANNASTWQDISGNGRPLTENGPNPVFIPSLINGHAALDFGGGARLATAPFPLTTDVTVFAVIQHRTPAQWGAIAHHGNRDDDWSMEQNGGGNSDVLHLQTNNDNTNVDVMLVTNENYIMTGRFDGLDRYFSATALGGTSPAPATFTDVTQSITPGSKPLFVGRSSNSTANEASNAFIGELVYYNRALSDVERDAVIAYLSDLWRAW